MILRCPSIRKCANFLFLFFFKFLDSLTDFLNDHLRNVAGGRTENGDHGIGVEIEDMLEVLTGEILMRIIACTGKSHKSDAAFECVFQPYLKARIVQIFQKAITFDSVQIGKVI